MRLFFRWLWAFVAGIGSPRALWRLRGDGFEPVTICPCGKLMHWSLATCARARVCRACDLVHKATLVVVRGERIVLLEIEWFRVARVLLHGLSEIYGPRSKARRWSPR